MSLLRLIARLDIKGANVVKGINFEGLRVVGKPADLAKKYAEAGADELLYLDTVATLYGRNQLEALLEKTCEEVFIPVTVGGGIASCGTARSLLRAGADKVAVNTAAVKSPDLIARIADQCGTQALCISIEAKRVNGGWEAYTDNGREKTGKDAVRWAHEAVEFGAGELLITSIDQDGTRKGFDVALIKAIAPNVSVPVTACGGAGSLDHIKQVIREGKADAVAMASVLHSGRLTFEEIRKGL